MDGKKIYENLPKVVRSILANSEGWLVGGAVMELSEGKIPKDFDILIDDRQRFMNTVNILKHIGQDREFNSLGGIKFKFEGVIIDIWCESLHHFLMNRSKKSAIYCLRKQILLIDN